MSNQNTWMHVGTTGPEASIHDHVGLDIPFYHFTFLYFRYLSFTKLHNFAQGNFITHEEICIF